MQALRRAVVGHRLKDALHLLAKLGKTGTLVSDGRRSCAKGAKINDPANSVWREKCAVFQANTMRVKEAKKAAKLQGGITQQSAEDATFQQNGVDVESARSAGFIPPVNSPLEKAFANHKPQVPSHRKADPRHRKSDPERSSRLPLRCCLP